MSMDVNCLGCGGFLFKKDSADEEVTWRIDLSTLPELGDDGTDRFVRCPHCSAKNVLIETIGSTNTPVYDVSHIKKD